MYKKRFIVDNDGCDIFMKPEVVDASYEGFIKARLLPLKGSGATSLFYTTQSSGFNVFTHKTELGDLFVENVQYGTTSINVAQQIFDRGTDCLHYVERFCRENGLEFFWGMRMNDTHDAWIPPYLEQNHFKMNHPEYLLGTKENKPKHGAWTSVNFIYPEVRELTWKLVEEVCRNYDVDGIFLDFFRHPICFANPSMGEHASAEEIAAMTDLIGQIRNVTKEEGKRRGRPIEVAIRVPDCTEFSRFLGLDIEDWLKKGYLDALMTTSYLQLNDWEYSVELGHRYGVAVYPSLDEPRMGRFDEACQKLRGSASSMRGRCENAMNSGADGIFFFNYIFNNCESRVDVITQTTDPNVMKTQDEVFFADFRGVGHVAGGCPPHLDYRKKQLLSPETPVKVDGKYTADLYVGADPYDRKPELHVVIDGEWQNFSVAVNGTVLTHFAEEGKMVAVVPKEVLRRGMNHVTFMGEGTVKDLYLTLTAETV